HFWSYLFYYIAILSLLFFFFQAEDGIRDRNVTGVQTCALPICLLPEVREAPVGATGGTRAEPGRGGRSSRCGSDQRRPGAGEPYRRTDHSRKRVHPDQRDDRGTGRSEERRVGIEGGGERRQERG